jgi:hypothetical protein
MDGIGVVRALTGLACAAIAVAIGLQALGERAVRGRRR